MIIEFAFGLIGALLVLANFRRMRNLSFSIAAMVLATGLASTGVYLMMATSKDTDGRMFFPFFTPLTAWILLQLTRMIYKFKTDKEIIFHLHGLFPVKIDERHVTGHEKLITATILILSVVLPFLILLIFNK